MESDGLRRVLTCDTASCEAALGAENVLLVQVYGESGVVVGSPHHAPRGTPFLFDSRVADENAGLLALRVAEDLGARAVIACCPRTHDPNKCDGTYLQEALRPPVRALVEVHGHAGVRPPHKQPRARFDVEVSTGARETQAVAEALAARLAGHCEAFARGTLHTGEDADVPAVREAIGALTISACWDDIFLRARGTLSIRRAREAGLTALHVELPPSVRLDPESDGLPPAGRALSGLLSAALAEVLGTDGATERVRRIRSPS